MKTITIPESEYLQLQQTIDILQQQLQLLQDQLKGYATLKYAKGQLTPSSLPSYQPVSLKRGSAKTIITYIAEDFTAPLQDFQDYTS